MEKPVGLSDGKQEDVTGRMVLKRLPGMVIPVLITKKGVLDFKY